MEFTATSRLEHGKLVVEVEAPEADERTRYAYYLCKNGKGVLVKQMYTSKNTFTFDLPDSGQYYVKVYVRHWPNGAHEAYETAAKSTNIVTFYPTCALRYEELAQRDFRVPEGIIYDILWRGVHFEFFVNYKPGSGQAVIFGTGDVGAKKIRPSFDRISWAGEIPGTAIYYFDPTIYLGESSLGWGYGTNDRWYLEEIAVLLKKLLDKMDIPVSNTLFYGSSAGGFMSMGLAAMLRSRATVINPQFTVENFWPRLVGIMKESCPKEGESLLTEHTHVAAIFEEQHYFPLLHVIENIKSKPDFTMHLSPFLTELTGMSLSCTGRLTVDFYSDQGGHNAMPSKAVCLDHIVKDLAQPLPEGDVPGEDSLLCRMARGEFDCPAPLQVACGDKDDSPQPPQGEGTPHSGGGNSSEKAQEVFQLRDGACSNGVNGKTCCDFDSCGLPKPSAYFPPSQLESVAQDIMDGKLWVHRAIDPMPYTLDTLDFNAQWSKAPQTFQLYLQALNPIQALTQAFEATRDSAYLEFAARFLQCWETYSSNPTLTRSNQYAFGDHAVALRAENLMYFGQVCSKVGIWADQLYRHLYQLLVKHGELLCNDAHYTKRHNHGVMQDQALIHLGFVLGRQDWIEHAKERLLQQEQFAFNAECVHTENSPGYADLVSKLFANIGQFLTQNGDPLGEKLVSDMKTTGEFVGWTIKPNGIVAQVGDTVNIPGRLYGPTNKMRRHTPQEHKFYPLSGYYFYRSNRGDEARRDTWKLLKSGYVQMTHKHADDCSFMLYSKGYEIFVDCGMYGYTRDAFRAYFTSALAHNTVIVDGATYPCDKNHTHCAGMRGYHAFPGYDHVRVFNDAYNGVKFQRDFCSADDLTLIVDTLESRSKHTYSQLFHLGERMELIKAGDREVLIRLADSGYRVRLRQYGGPVKLELIRGNKEKPGLGLISRGTTHLDIITTLKFNLTGTSSVFATAITIEDNDGLVRLGDVKAQAAELGFDSQTQTFTLGGLTIPYAQPLSDTAGQ